MASVDELRNRPGVLSVDEREDGGFGVRVARSEDHPNPPGADVFRELGFTVRREVTMAYSQGYILDVEGPR